MAEGLVRGVAAPVLRAARARLELAVEDEGEVTFDMGEEGDVFELVLSRSRWEALGSPRALEVRVVSE